MKKLPSVKALMALTAILLVNLLLSAIVINESKEINNSETIIFNHYLLVDQVNNRDLLMEKKDSFVSEVVQEVVIEEPIVYDGMTEEQLIHKLDKNLKSTLTGYGKVFAKYFLQYGVDPYLALSIVLHETGCASGKCSTLTSECNNVGGMKGIYKCGNSSYAKFNSLESGIEAFFKNLATNYYQQGLKTPEQIGKKYAESSTWASRIRYYMEQIRNS